VPAVEFDPAWNRGLNTKTPLSPAALPAATTVGKPPSACAKRSSEISWNISSYPLHEESRRDIRQMEAIDPECKMSHQLTGSRGDLRSPPRFVNRDDIVQRTRCSLGHGASLFRADEVIE
jgi:hypothetical protein